MGISETRKKQNRFRRFLKASIFFTYLVILAGGLVRMTGSGMGCPDWPKCFGTYIPPTDISQLPEGYEQHYIEIRKEKNLKLAKMIRPLGLEELADRISEDPSIYEETAFVWQRTWTEYLNRLAGATLGIVLLLSFAFSLLYWQKRRFIPLLVLGVIIVTAFQGWMGSVVVSTNLLPGVLTVHMLLAFILIYGLVYIYVKTAPGKRAPSSSNNTNTLRYALGLLLVLTLVQVLLGTQVRQQIDVIAKAHEFIDRGTWIGQLNWKFKVHRSFSILLLLGNGWLIYQVLKYLHHYFALYRAAIYLGAFLAIEVLNGVIMAYLGMPRWSQPLHLLFSCLIFGAQVYMFVALGRKTRIQTVSMIAT